MFKDWDNFYLLVGGAAGALIGIMFVVATLTADMESKRMAQGSRIYITPIVFHFSVVLVVSATTAVPELPASVLGVLLLLLAGCGIAYAIVTTLRMFRLNWADGLPDMSDKCFYGIFPAIAYVLLAATGVAVWLRPEAAVYSTGAVMLILLLIGIRNAWDLATFFVLRDPDKKE